MTLQFRPALVSFVPKETPLLSDKYSLFITFFICEAKEPNNHIPILPVLRQPGGSNEFSRSAKNYSCSRSFRLMLWTASTSARAFSGGVNWEIP